MNILLSLLLPTIALAGFEDVPTEHPHASAISYIQEQDIVQGYEDSTYQPDRTISRIEFLKILIETEIPETPGCKRYYNYSDVDWNTWYGQYVQIASCLGIVSGYEDGLFRPHNTVTYAEASKIISGVYVFEVLPDEPWPDAYTSKIQEKGVQPRTNIQATDKLTRGEMAQMIYFLESDSQNIPTSNIKFEELETSIKEEMESQHIPALSMLIFQHDQKIYERFFGKSHLQSNQDLQKNHLFLLASISKVITATALLQLYDQGKFALDDPINNYLPFTVSIPGHVTTAITFRMLLTHTSGIADGSALDDQYYDGQDSPIALGGFLEQYLTLEGNLYNEEDNFHNFKPGTRHEYSNTGSALIGFLVEIISKQNFAEYCQEHIFSPLEMSNTFWSLNRAIDAHKTIVQPYNYEDRHYKSVEHYTFTDYPNGGLRSTADDLFKFAQIFLQQGTWNTIQILKPETITEMLQVQLPKIDSDMGLHIFAFNKEQTFWGHNGGEEGVTTVWAFDSHHKFGIIILTNMSDIDLDNVFEEAYQLIQQ